MSGTTWTKFFWSDWESDPALRLCTFSAQGLWMRMLCIAAAHDPIGYVAVAGRALSETDIARMTGGSESEVCALLGELDRNGVFSRDRHGRIYSRRMISDAKRAAIARKNGKNGGNPNLRKGEENSSSDNPSDKGGLKPQEPEAINQKEETDANASSVGSAAPIATEREPWKNDSDFVAAWGACTEQGRRRSSQKKSWPEWRGAVKRISGDALARAQRRYASEDEDAKRTGGPGFHIWLKDCRWEHWLSAPGIAASSIRFPGPPQLRAWILEHVQDEGFVIKYIDPANYDEARRVIIAHNPFAASKINTECAPVLARAKVTVEVANPTQNPSDRSAA